MYKMIKNVAKGNVLNKFSKVDPYALSGANPAKMYNLLDGNWVDTKEHTIVPDPMNGEPFVEIPKADMNDLKQFAASMNSCPKSGRHNPFKNPERYLMYGEICRKAGSIMKDDEEIRDHFARLIQRCMPKSYVQAMGELGVTGKMMENFAGDNTRFLASGTTDVGDYLGQHNTGYRWPFGPVAVIGPFNFPLEIPGCQLLGSLLMGNKPVLKTNTKTSIVMDEFVRFLIHCGMPQDDVNILNCTGGMFNSLYDLADMRVTQFTGGSDTAEWLLEKTNGKVKIEDAGFDWKILGPDVDNFDNVAWQCDQDAYALTGQKCSAQSILFAHKNWVEKGLYPKLASIAATRKLDDLTIGAVLSVTNKDFIEHRDAILKLEGAKVAFGGDLLAPKVKHAIPEVYGSFECTAMSVPIKHFFSDDATFKLLTTEIFGPFQVLVEYEDHEIDKVIQICEKMSHHLTAAVVSRDQEWRNHVLGNTVNGTTYCGIRARTTGAPQNHWFGPAGDPRGAGIATKYAVQLVWSCHREIIFDEGPIPKDWKMPPPS